MKYILLFFAFPFFTIAQDGTLDTTFDNDGIVTTTLFDTNDGGKCVAVQNDGKIIVGGYGNNGNFVFALVRYNTDGSLDTTFDGDGIVTTAIANHDAIQAITIQNNGKIVAVGTSDNGTSNLADFALVRYNSNGSLDTTFGVGGKVVTPIGSSNDYCNSVAIQSDGKIVVSGGALTSLFTSVIVVARYNSNGTLDATFGLNGKVTTSIGSYAMAVGVFIRNDGKIEVAGYGTTTTSDFALLRYNANGTLDTTFNIDGIVTTDFGSNESCSSFAKQSDGKIILFGTSSIGGNNDFVIARYNTDGSLDSTFDGDGKITTDFSTVYDYGFSGVIQSDGKIIMSGFQSITGGSDFILSRYNSNGTLDSTFGTNGKVITSVNLNDFGYGLTLQNNGKILLVGRSSPLQSNFDVTILRFNNPSLENETFRVNIDLCVYPNPTSNTLYVNLNSDLIFEKATIYNPLGQIIKTETTQNINITNLSSGTYFIEVVTDKGKATKSFIKE